MIITYEGAEFIKIQQGNTILAFNPISKNSNLKSSNFGADVALVTANHPDLNGVETVTRGEKEPFVINGPGEYEVEGLFIKGYPTKTHYGGTEKINTIFSTKIDNINIVFLGAISDTDFSSEIKEDLDDVDILFVPIGGEGVLDASDAYRFAVKREPKLIIPIHFGDIGSKDALKSFLKEGGSEDTKSVEKLTVKVKDIEKSEGEIVVLKANNN